MVLIFGAQTLCKLNATCFANIALWCLGVAGRTGHFSDAPMDGHGLRFAFLLGQTFAKSKVAFEHRQICTYFLELEFDI